MNKPVRNLYSMEIFHQCFRLVTSALSFDPGWDVAACKWEPSIKYPNIEEAEKWDNNCKPTRIGSVENVPAMEVRRVIEMWSTCSPVFHWESKNKVTLDRFYVEVVEELAKVGVIFSREHSHGNIDFVLAISGFVWVANHRQFAGLVLISVAGTVWLEYWYLRIRKESHYNQLFAASMHKSSQPDLIRRWLQISVRFCYPFCTLAKIFMKLGKEYRYILLHTEKGGVFYMSRYYPTWAAGIIDQRTSMTSICQDCSVSIKLLLPPLRKSPNPAAPKQGLLMYISKSACFFPIAFSLLSNTCWFATFRLFVFLLI